MPLIGLQYFDEIEVDGVADAAGLKRSDFLLAVNESDVRFMSHENVVQLIRQSGDKVTMTIATPMPKQLVSILKKKEKSDKLAANSSSLKSPEIIPSADKAESSQMSQSTCSTLGNKASKALPPAPPKRDPSTTLTSTRARARSLVVPSEVRSAQTMMIMTEHEDKSNSMSNAQPHSLPLTKQQSTDNSESQELPPPPSLIEIQSSIVNILPMIYELVSLTVSFIRSRCQ